MANPFDVATAIVRSQKATPVTSSFLPVHLDRQAHFSKWDVREAIEGGYKSSSWVYGAVTAKMNAASSVPWHAVDRASGEELPDHPLTRLIENPNPAMSRSDLIKRMVVLLDMSGNTLLSKIEATTRNDRRERFRSIVELWPLPVANVKPVVRRGQHIVKYEWTVDGKPQFMDADKVVHLMYVDPANPYWGMSPLEAISRPIDTDVEAVKWNKIALQNRSIPDGVFSTDLPMSTPQWEEARARVREQHQGQKNARAPWVLSGGVKWQPMSLSPAEMDFIDSRKFTREEIVAALGVPLPMIHIYENATLANIETARKIFWLDTIVPLLDDVKTVFNRSVTPAFGPDVELTYDLSDVDAVRDDFSKKVKDALSLAKMGVPFDQINKKLELGFEEFDGWDISWRPTNQLPSDEITSLGEED